MVGRKPFKLLCKNICVQEIHYFYSVVELRYTEKDLVVVVGPCCCNWSNTETAPGPVLPLFGLYLYKNNISLLFVAKDETYYYIL